MLDNQQDQRSGISLFFQLVCWLPGCLVTVVLLFSPITPALALTWGRNTALPNDMNGLFMGVCECFVSLCARQEYYTLKRGQ